MTEIKIFSSLRFGAIRSSTNESGEPLFCLADLCRMLDLTDLGYLKSILDSEDICKKPVMDSKGRKQEVLFVTEHGMYSIIFRSDSPIAKPLQKWVVNEVLPSFRKGGGFIIVHPNEMPEQFMANRTFSGIKSKKNVPNIRLALERGICEEGAPNYYNNFSLRQVCMPIAIIAKEMGMSAEVLNNKLYEAHIQDKVGSSWVLNTEHANKGWAKFLNFDSSISHIPMLGSYWWTLKGRSMIHRDFS